MRILQFALVLTSSLMVWAAVTDNTRIYLPVNTAPRKLNLAYSNPQQQFHNGRPTTTTTGFYTSKPILINPDINGLGLNCLVILNTGPYLYNTPGLYGSTLGQYQQNNNQGLYGITLGPNNAGLNGAYNNPNFVGSSETNFFYNPSIGSGSMTGGSIVNTGHSGSGSAGLNVVDPANSAIKPKTIILADDGFIVAKK